MTQRAISGASTSKSQPAELVNFASWEELTSPDSPCSFRTGAMSTPGDDLAHPTSRRHEASAPRAAFFARLAAFLEALDALDEFLVVGGDLVVSAGAKAILDLKLTLEYLETFGIPVIGFKTDEFPAFYSRTSGLGVDYRIDKVEELAHTLFTKWNLGMKGGVLIANPILRKDEMKFNSINQAIEDAISIAEKKGIKGKKITPFLLEKIGKLTEGKSLEANIQLVYNNAKLATKIAIAFAKERKKYNF